MADASVETVTFDAQAAGADVLTLRVHRPAYRDAAVNPRRGAKASVRLNGGAWIDLTDEHASALGLAADYGGIDGAALTVDMRVPIDGARDGSNELSFRFNGTDGVTSGYRVLAFNLRSGREVLISPARFRQVDPADFSAAAGANAARGRRLWREARLQISPLAQSSFLASTCNDCHADDGRDLSYFNYSNESIVERARFHGLSRADGRDIAAYIRGNPAPHVSQARPWNPPYQPGEGLDSRPAHEWAAGAGLAAVLPDDAAMIGELFPAGTSQAAVDEVLDIKKTLNMRELAIPLQLPDWNAWLPHEHPKDIWGAKFADSGVYDDYEAAVASARAARAGSTQQVEAFDEDLQAFMAGTWDVTMFAMGGAQPCKNFAKRAREGHANGDVLITDMPGDKTCEDGLLAVNHWLAVKNWELFQGHDLEDRTPELYEFGEARGWFGRNRNVFEVAPHRTADNSNYNRHQTEGMGAYETNAWYHLQLILNAGHRNPQRFFPQDWFYTGDWIALNAKRNGGVNLSTLSTAAHLKMLETLNTTGPTGQGRDRGPGARGWWVSFTHPWRLETRLPYGEPGAPLRDLDAYDAGLHRRVTNSLLGEWLWKIRTYDVDALPRLSTRQKTGYDPVGTIVDAEIPPPGERDCFYVCGEGSKVARNFYRALWRFREIGVDAGIRDGVIDWAKEVWPHPNNDWDALRGSLGDEYELTVVGGSGGGTYAAKSRVTVEADVAAGRRFVRWRVAGPGKIADATAAKTAFVLGDGDTRLTAVTAKIAAAEVYALEVLGGDGSGEYPSGDRVTIVARPPSGMEFVAWRAEGSGRLVKPSAATTQFVIGSGPATVVARFATVDARGTVEVIGGAGSGTYAPGDLILVTAEVPPGQRFVRWHHEGPGELKRVWAKESRYVVAAGAATLTAQFSEVAPSERVVIRARGTCGNETMVLEIDGSVVAKWENLDTEFRTYQYEPSGPVAQRIRLFFIPRAGEVDCAGELSVDYLRSGTGISQAEAQPINTGYLPPGKTCDDFRPAKPRPGHRGVLHCRGYILFEGSGNPSLQLSRPDASALALEPNPVGRGGWVDIRLGGLSDHAEFVTVVNALGHVALRLPVASDEPALTIPNVDLPPGIYVITVYGDGGVNYGSRRLYVQ